MELDFVVSLRHGDESTSSCWGEVDVLADAGVEAAADALGVEAAALEKKPRMLFCCLPVDGTLALLAIDDDGVRAGAPILPMTPDTRREAIGL